jgi:hypothetical protein
MILCNVVGKELHFKYMDYEVIPRVSMKIIISVMWCCIIW